MINITDKKECTGCRACVQRCPKECINFESDAEGFFYPRVDVSRCIDCRLCEKVCPVLNPLANRIPLRVLAAKSGDGQVRAESSSGGVFSLLASKIIDQSGVVFGAAWDADWQVHHTCVDDRSALWRLRGSKYVQSNTGDTFRQAEELLMQGRQVLFSGTGCQIAGLTLFLGRSYPNLLTVEVACHGVPSGKVWAAYLDGLHLSQISSVCMRDKSTGWKRYSVAICHVDGSLSEPFFRNPYMRGFLNDIYLRPSCYACPSKAMATASDILLADYWGIDRVDDGFDDDAGVSLIMVATQHGAEVVDSLNMTSIETGFAEAVRMNRAIVTSTKLTPKREQFFSGFGCEPFDVLVGRLTATGRWKKMVRRVRKAMRRLMGNKH